MRRRHRAIGRFRFESLDNVIAIGIVGLLLALCIHDVAALAFKARVIGVFFAETSERGDSQELMAVTGDFPPPQTTGSLYKADSQRAPFELVAAGPALVAKGTVGQDAQPFAISFTPALSDDAEASVRWLCGRHRAPAGWHAASAPAVLVLPYGASFSICRDDGAEAQ